MAALRRGARRNRRHGSQADRRLAVASARARRHLEDARDQIDIALVPITTALQRLCPVEYLAGSTFFFRHGDTLLGQKLREQLVRAGYSHVTQVIAPGEYSFRGGLIDIFPMGSALPYRIDLLDDQIDTIRTFDVDTQRSIYKVNEVRLLPARAYRVDSIPNMSMGKSAAAGRARKSVCST